MGDELLVDVRGDVAILTLNRPEVRNALSGAMLTSLCTALTEMDRGRRIRCAVLRGAGDKAFSAGMDLGAMAGGTPGGNMERMGAGDSPLRAAYAAVEQVSFPVVAMIRGYALGAACELALTCDMRVGSESSTMGMPPGRLGIVYPPEGIKRFLRVVGLPATKRLFLTAEYLKGREAKELGLLDYLVPHGDLERFTYDLAVRISKNAPISNAGHKRALNILARSAALTEAEESELEALVRSAIESGDAREGLAAFSEKRDPDFKGE